MRNKSQPEPEFSSKTAKEQYYLDKDSDSSKYYTSYTFERSNKDFKVKFTIVNIVKILDYEKDFESDEVFNSYTRAKLSRVQAKLNRFFDLNSDRLKADKEIVIDFETGKLVK